MKPLATLGCCIVTLGAVGARAEGFLDRVDDALTFSAHDDQLRARISGLLDLEGYRFQPPAPGLIDTGSDSLFNPRLSLFLDSQLGSHVYVFAQARADRGFDPGDRGARIRPDEYALRYTPWDDGRLNLQAGTFATVTGTWNRRHLSWDNPFVTAPLLYENFTAIYDHEAPASPTKFSHELDEPKYEYNPVVWGPSYGTGASASGRLGKLDYPSR
ncbi:MAG: hypothetical protein DVB31_16865 [Verrucomicrobia bacterium]|nr:MAG: hypothetical protein DVB31_16865 [Verrucomicrobiota bacterium]